MHLIPEDVLWTRTKFLKEKCVRVQYVCDNYDQGRGPHGEGVVTCYYLCPMFVTDNT